jgi:hypothetical protein
MSIRERDYMKRPSDGYEDQSQEPVPWNVEPPKVIPVDPFAGLTKEKLPGPDSVSPQTVSAACDAEPPQNPPHNSNSKPDTSQAVVPDKKSRLLAYMVVAIVALASGIIIGIIFSKKGF